MRGIYTLTKGITNPSTANVVVQLKGAGSKAYKIHRLTITQTGSTATANAEVKVQRLSASGTAGTAFVQGDFGGRAAADPDISLSLTTTATAFSLGSAGTALSGRGPLIDRGFNVVTGFDDYPVPENRIDLPADGILGIFMPVAPAGTYLFEITLEELG